MSAAADKANIIQTGPACLVSPPALSACLPDPAHLASPPASFVLLHSCFVEVDFLQNNMP